MSGTESDYTISEEQLRSLATRHGLTDDQPWTVHDRCAGLVHRSDTRPDVLTHELATVLYRMQQDFSVARRTGFVVSELSDLVADLEPVTEGYGGHTLTYWKNVAVDGR